MPQGPGRLTPRPLVGPSLDENRIVIALSSILNLRGFQCDPRAASHVRLNGPQEFNLNRSPFPRGNPDAPTTDDIGSNHSGNPHLQA